MTTPTGSQTGVRPGANSALVSHLECSKTGRHFPKDTLYGMSPAGAPLIEGRVCQYENSPDGHFIIDRHPHVPNVIVAGGFSGHGFKFSILVGDILADLVIDGTTARPIERFRLERFA